MSPTSLHILKPSNMVQNEIMAMGECYPLTPLPQILNHLMAFSGHISAFIHGCYIEGVGIQNKNFVLFEFYITMIKNKFNTKGKAKTKLSSPKIFQLLQRGRGSVFKNSLKLLN